ncbi:hypothetical protein MPSEU_000682800 [Mayamaea pseudoterrestris]|nr:hypothetical protein MPSEU_000682800 [Mayamaea pseudoterrestris]
MKFSPLLLFAVGCSAFSTSSRRDLLQKAMAAVAMGGCAFLDPSIAQAMEACPRGTQNCIYTSWTPPEGVSKSDVVDTIRAVVTSYPQEGQGGVDNSGYTIAQDALADKGTARIEYRNFGNFAKFMNGGRPFVDDLLIEVAANDGNQVQVRSSSRVGESDFGVNQKRLLFFKKELQGRGWTVPEPRY